MKKYIAHSPAVVKAANKLYSDGFAFPDKPEEYDPQWDDLTDISDKQLMKYFSLFVAWSDYTGVQLAMALSDEKIAADRITILEAKHMATSSGRKVTERRAEMKSDDTIAEAKETLREREAYRRILEALYASYERKTQLLSREITRRTTHHRDSTP